MLNLLPRHMPTLQAMLEDIGNPTNKEIGRALRVSAGTARRWRREGEAPQVAMLAIFWLTRWGMSAVDAEAHNAAVLSAAIARATRRDNDKELANLLKVFAHMPIDAIAPMHVREYMDIRGKVAAVRANREKALLSHMFNKAREWGFTALQNPCQGVRGFQESGRSRYVTDAEFDQVKAQAHFTVADAMDLALLTGQRPADVLKLKRTDIRDGALCVTQNKTGARLEIEITGELAALIARIIERLRQAISPYLIQDTNGQRLTYHALRSRFDKARSLAKVDFQFRDIRAKAATDTGDLAHSQRLLAHKNRGMTEQYVKARIGERVKPLR